jgi:hypothetical protein
VSIVSTGNATHDAACLRAEILRQNVERTPGVTQATLNTATITFHRTVALSAIANKCGVEPSMSALHSLGHTIYS